MPRVYDLNRMRKTYPLVRKRPRLATLDDSLIESVTIDISDGIPKTYVFTNTYSSVPVCIVTPEQENVNAFISSINLTQVTIEISADPPDVCIVHLQIFRDTSVI